jgi:hypothetical protein
MGQAIMHSGPGISLLAGPTTMLDAFRRIDTQRLIDTVDG